MRQLGVAEFSHAIVGIGTDLAALMTIAINGVYSIKGFTGIDAPYEAPTAPEGSAVVADGLAAGLEAPVEGAVERPAKRTVKEA